MSLGANHPMGPLRLIDFVGIDVAIAIGRGLHTESGSERHAPPPLLDEMAAAGKLGRKSGAGFYDY
jgi:3-hydroxybutyryl-CoA dehydrogenase